MFMKKFGKIIALLLCVMASLSVIACGGGNGGSVGDSVKDDVGKIGKRGEKGTLSLNVYAAGYGTDWITSAVSLFLQDNAGVKYYLEASPLALSAVKTQLENGNCKDDVILVSAADYESYVAKGYIEDLTDVYQSVIPDSGKKVEEVIDANVMADKVINGKKYGIPWQDNPPSGLIYNKKMFERYGWAIPETMDEFWTLCDKIAEDTEGSVAPLTFGGADGNGYLYTNFPQWLSECYGANGMKEFFRLGSPEVYSVQQEGRAKVYSTLARLTKGKTSKGTDITLDGSVGATAITAQSNFINGRAAMIVGGTYFPTEMVDYIKIKNFDAGYMPMPHINADKKSIDGSKDTSNVLFSSDNGVFAIPVSAANKDLAKQFLIHMLTEKSYSSFVKATHGLLRPLKGVKVNTDGFDAFTLAAFNGFYHDDKAERVYAVTPNKVLEKDILAVFFAYEGGFFNRIAGAESYEAAKSIAEGCTANEISCVLKKWDANKNEWKI